LKAKNYFTSTIISFLLKSGKLRGGLYCAEIMSPTCVYPSLLRKEARSSFFAFTLDSVAHRVYLKTAFVAFGISTKLILASFGFGRLSRVYFFGIEN
jgi:hypothetical protein